MLPASWPIQQGADCRNPLGRLHPTGDVTSLEQALNPRWDVFYQNLTRFSFRQCLPYLSFANEPSFLPSESSLLVVPCLSLLGWLLGAGLA